MEQKNQNEYLKLKNFSSFLFDLGLNVSFFQDRDIEVEQDKFEVKFKSIGEIDDYITEWQIKNDFQLISRNKNIFSKNILLLSEKNIYINFDQSKKNQNYWIRCFFQLGKT